MFLEALDEHQKVFATLSSLAESVENASILISESLRRGNKLMLCGNGGSAADSQHLAAEFTGRFTKDRKPLAAMALSTDTSALTCIANDYSFDEVFSRQINALGRDGDCLIAISTSGCSMNIIRAVQTSRLLGILVVGLLGRDGGVLAQMCDLSIIVPSETTARIQEAHILIGHAICGSIEKNLSLV